VIANHPHGEGKPEDANHQERQEPDGQGDTEVPDDCDKPLTPVGQQLCLEKRPTLLTQGEPETIGGCNDCHTPLKMGPKGPEPDMTRMLSGPTPLPAMAEQTAENRTGGL
jgi:hypothetical protein